MTTTDPIAFAEEAILAQLRERSNQDIDIDVLVRGASTSYLDIKVVGEARRAGLDVPADGDWPPFRLALGRLERRGSIVNLGVRFTVGRRREKHWAIPEVHLAALAEQERQAQEQARIRNRVSVRKTTFSDQAWYVWLDADELDPTMLAQFTTNELFDAQEEAEAFAAKVRQTLVKKS